MYTSYRRKMDFRAYKMTLLKWEHPSFIYFAYGKWLIRFLFLSWLIWNNVTFPCFSYGVPFILSSVQTPFLTISLPLLLWAGGKKNKERETGWLTEEQSWLIKQVHKLNAIFHISITIDYFSFAVNLWVWLSASLKILRKIRITVGFGVHGVYRWGVRIWALVYLR